MKYCQAVSGLTKILEEMIPSAEGVFTEAAAALARLIGDGRKILIFGNGGSAAQAQHFAAALVNRFLRDRRPLPALALTTDASILTSIGNDSSFTSVFSRQVLALGREGDAAVGLSTSGNSANVVEGLRAARSLRMITVALTGQGGGKMKEEADYWIAVPSTHTPRIQEAHLLLLHLLAEELENTL